MDFSSLLLTSVYCIGSMVVGTLILKTVLFFRFEREWDPIGFFYFSKPALKMTAMKSLKTWRKRQNALTNVFIVLLVLLAGITMFRMVILS